MKLDRKECIQSYFQVSEGESVNVLPVIPRMLRTEVNRGNKLAIGSDSQGSSFAFRIEGALDKDDVAFGHMVF